MHTLVARAVAADPAGNVDNHFTGCFAGIGIKLHASALEGESAMDRVQRIVHGKIDLSLGGIQLESGRARHSAGDADKKPNQVSHETANTSDVAPTCTASSFSKIAGSNAIPRNARGRSQGNRSSDSIKPAINAGRRIRRRCAA